MVKFSKYEFNNNDWSERPTKNSFIYDHII